MAEVNNNKSTMQVYEAEQMKSVIAKHNSSNRATTMTKIAVACLLMLSAFAVAHLFTPALYRALDQTVSLGLIGSVKVLALAYGGAIVVLSLLITTIVARNFGHKSITLEPPKELNISPQVDIDPALARLQKEHAQQQQELLSARTQLEQQQQEIAHQKQTFNQRLASSERAFVEAQEDTLAKNARVQELQSQVTTLQNEPTSTTNADLISLQQQLAQAQQEHRASEQRENEFHEKLEQERANTKKQLEILTTSIHQKESDYRALEERLAEQTSRIRELTDEAAYMNIQEEEISSLSKQLETLRADLERLEQEKKSLAMQKLATEAEQAFYIEETTEKFEYATQTRIPDLINTIRQLEAELIALQQHRSELEESHREMLEKTARLQTEKENAITYEADLSLDVEELEQENEKLKRTQEELQNVHRASEKEYGIMNQAYQFLLNQLDQITGTAAKLTAENARLKLELQQRHVANQDNTELALMNLEAEAEAEAEGILEDEQHLAHFLKELRAVTEKQEKKIEALDQQLQEEKKKNLLLQSEAVTRDYTQLEGELTSSRSTLANMGPLVENTENTKNTMREKDELRRQLTTQQTMSPSTNQGNSGEEDYRRFWMSTIKTANVNSQEQVEGNPFGTNPFLSIDEEETQASIADPAIYDFFPLTSELPSEFEITTIHSDHATLEYQDKIVRWSEYLPPPEAEPVSSKGLPSKNDSAFEITTIHPDHATLEYQENTVRWTDHLLQQEPEPVGGKDLLSEDNLPQSSSQISRKNSSGRKSSGEEQDLATFLAEDYSISPPETKQAADTKQNTSLIEVVLAARRAGKTLSNMLKRSSK